jgi:putative PEP-CTERM system TPR-repeat lipoprotein
MRINASRAALLSALILLGACSGPTPEQQIASAQRSIAEGDRRTAFVELKSALQESPDNALARRLLGELHLAVEEGAAAEKELRRARELGAPPELVTPSLVKALLLQDRFDEVLALLADPDLLAAAPAELHAAQGLALLGLGDSANADQAMTKALAADPQNGFALLARARLQAKAGRADEAVVTAREVVRLHPADGVAWSTLGGLLMAKRDLAGAEDAYTQAVQHRARSLDDRLQRALARIGQGKLDAARDDVDVLLTQAPKESAVQFVAGLWRSQRGEPEKALEALELSYQWNPQSQPTMLLLATNYALLGNRERALGIVERLVGIASTLVPARVLRARLLLAEGSVDEAAAVLSAVVRERPELSEARQLLAMAMLRQGKAADAESLLGDIVAAQPESPLLQLQLGLTRLAVGKADAGLAAMEKAGRLAPGDTAVQSALVAAQLRQKDLDDAVATAQRFAQDHPGEAAAHNLVGTARLAREEPEQAAAAFERALAQDRGNVTASRALAGIRAAQGDLKGAETVLAEAAKHHPEDLGVALSRVVVLERQGSAAAAVDLLSATVQRHPEHAAPRFLLGRVLLRQGKSAEAVAALDTPAVRANPAGALLLADAFRRAGALERAKPILDELVRVGPVNREVLGMLLAIDEAQGDWAAVERTLAMLAPLAPGDDRVALAKARLLAAQGRPDEARTLLSGLELDSAAPDVLRTKLLVAQRGGDTVAERAAAQALFERVPATATVLALAHAHARADARDEAETLLAEWTSRHPEDRPALLALADLYSRSGKRDESLSAYRRVLALDPSNVAALNQLAWEVRKTDPKQAVELAERAVARASDDPTVVDTLAMALLEEGRYHQALEMNDRVIRLVPDHNLFLLHRAEILYRSGQTASAARLLEELLDRELSPNLRAEADTLRRAWDL